MGDDRIGSRLADLLHTLKPKTKTKTKQPASVTVLNNWISQAEGKLGAEGKGGRLGWLVASSVAIACDPRHGQWPAVTASQLIEAASERLDGVTG